MHYFRASLLSCLLVNIINIVVNYEMRRRIKGRRFDASTRLELARRFTTMYRNAGMDRAACAKFLHVTERTLDNWESGTHDIPYAAYRLMRVASGLTIIGAQWENWRISGGCLITPEGHALNPISANWWSLLCRRAETGSKAIAELARLRAILSTNASSEPQKTTDFLAPAFSQAGVVAPPDSPARETIKRQICYQNYSFASAPSLAMLGYRSSLPLASGKGAPLEGKGSQSAAAVPLPYGYSSQKGGAR